MNGREYTIKLSSFELGILSGLIMQSDDITRQALKGVWDQLMVFKKQFEKEAGVKKEVLPGGMFMITDKDGNVIIRAPFPWELKGN